jgi:hypothetical protein
MPRRTVSVVDARTGPNDALISRRRELLLYRSHGGSLPVHRYYRQQIHKLAFIRTEDGLIIIILLVVTIKTKQTDQRNDEIRD